MGPKTTFAVLSYLAVVIALAIGVMPPLFFIALEYRHEKAAVTVEAEINARIVGQLIAANPDLWSFEQLRLEELLSRRPADGNSREARAIYGLDGKPIAESRDQITPPYITGSADLFDSGRRVGRIDVVRSLEPAIDTMLATCLVSSVLGLMVFGIIRSLPLRALRQAFDELSEEKEKAQVTLHSIADAVIATDAEGRIELLNPVAEALTGWSSAEARGRPVDSVLRVYFENSRLPAASSIASCLEGNEAAEVAEHIILVRRTDSMEFHIEHTAAPIRRQDGSILGAVMIFHDVTDRRIAQNRLQHIAYHDALTGLPNRALFRNKIAKAMVDARFLNKRVAVLFLDLDRFKTINDSLGHAIGDELLVMAGTRLGRCVRGSDILCRIGGDEFAAVLTNIVEPENAAAVAAKIIETLAQPFEINGHELRISASIGIAIYPDDGEDVDTLLKNADGAMYHAKAQGRNNYQHYNASMSSKAATRLQYENALHSALANGEYFLEYQPKLDLARNAIVGSEALLRWQSPEFGRVMPADFIPPLEESGIIVQVGDWVLESAIAQARRWLDAGRPIAVAVNVSARQFRQHGLVARIAGLLEASGLPPSLLQIEITESLLMDDAERSEAVMRRLIDLGVRISLDDFGTGYSSLSYLRRFPITELKIDRAFVDGMEGDTSARQIVKTVIELGHALGMRVTAEGVETERQLGHLRVLGCDEMQGYVLSRPLPCGAFDALLASFDPAARSGAAEETHA